MRSRFKITSFSCVTVSRNEKYGFMNSGTCFLELGHPCFMVFKSKIDSGSFNIACLTPGSRSSGISSKTLTIKIRENEIEHHQYSAR